MSNDTGFDSYHSPKEVQIGVPRSRNDTNTYTECRKNYPVYVNHIDQSYNFTGNSFKRSELVDKQSLNLLSQPPSTSTAYEQ